MQWEISFVRLIADGMMYYFLDGLQHCPEELVPKQLINLERIIPISAKNVKEIDKVKQAIRDVLDEKAAEQLREDAKDGDNLEELRGKLDEKGPRVG